MTTQKKSVLGRGLSALIPKTTVKEVSVRSDDIGRDSGGEGVIARIDLARIRPNPFQPRAEFDPESLSELTRSIVEKGVIQPITVRRVTDGYQLISGERRLRAAHSAGLEQIPAYIISVESDEEMLELALVENIQRETLNPIEIATAYKRLIEECHLTQEDVAEKVGKDRTTVTNFLRLLKLPEEIQNGLKKNCGFFVKRTIKYLQWKREWLYSAEPSSWEATIAGLVTGVYFYPAAMAGCGSETIQAV